MLRKVSTLLAAGAAALAIGLTGAGPATAAPAGPGAVPPAADGPKQNRPAAARAGDVSTLASSCWYSSGRWWCNNVSGASVYASGTLDHVGTMYSNPSWFVCRSDNGGYVGGPHPYRWVWTQADNGAWGWMKDVDIYSETDSLPVC